MTFLPFSYAILSLQLCHFVPPAMPFCPFLRFAMPFCPFAFTPHVVFMFIESLQNCTFPSTQKISVIKNNIEKHIARWNAGLPFYNLKRNATQKTQNAKSERERAYFFWILFSKNIFHFWV